MIKLLILINNFGMGGAQNMIYEQLKCIDRETFDVSVLCFAHRENDSLANKVEKIQSVKYLNLYGKPLPVMLFKIFREIDKIKPDIIHSHLGGNVFSVLWGLLHNKSVVVTAHTSPEKAFPKRLIPFLKLGIRKKNVRIVAVSKENRQLMKSFFNIGDDRCHYVNNGIDLERYYRKQHEKFTFINVGRQDENKNQIAIVKCFARLKKEIPNIMLYLVGDGDKHDMLIEETKRMELEDCVILTGNVANTEDYYAVSDCYVQSSHREAMPLTALEAMAAGLPLISTDVGGMKDIVSNENGYLIDDGDEEALYKSMKNMAIISSEKRDMLQKVSLDKIKQYSSKQMAGNYEQIYLIKDAKQDDKNLEKSR